MSGTFCWLRLTRVMRRSLAWPGLCCVLDSSCRWAKNSGIIFCILSLLYNGAYYNDIHISHFMVFQINKNLFQKLWSWRHFIFVFVKQILLQFLILLFDHEILTSSNHVKEKLSTIHICYNLFNILIGNTLETFWWWLFMMKDVKLYSRCCGTQRNIFLIVYVYLLGWTSWLPNTGLWCLTVTCHGHIHWN